MSDQEESGIKVNTSPLTIGGYAIFVAGRLAPATKNPLNPIEDCSYQGKRLRMLHCAVGISVELLEYRESEDDKQAVEELGDMLFYTIATANLVGITPMELHYYLNLPTECFQNTIETDVIELCDQMKKIYAYEQPHTPEEIKKKLAPLIGNVLYGILCELHMNPLVDDGVNLMEYLIASNQEKLSSRYKEKFTVEESIQRADKCQKSDTELLSTENQE